MTRTVLFVAGVVAEGVMVVAGVVVEAGAVVEGELAHKDPGTRTQTTRMCKCLIACSNIRSVMCRSFHAGTLIFVGKHGISSSTDSPAPKDLRPFVQTTGPAERTKRAKNTLAVFKLFITVAVIDNILQQTKICSSAGCC